MDHNKFKKNTYIDDILEQLVNYVINNMQNKEIQNKIQKKILDPTIDYIGRRLYPYILMLSLCFVFIILLIFFMIYTK